MSNTYIKKSDKSSKIANFKIYKIGLYESLGIYTKKAPQKVHYQKWCRWQEEVLVHAVPILYL